MIAEAPRDAALSAEGLYYGSPGYLAPRRIPCFRLAGGGEAFLSLVGPARAC